MSALCQKQTYAVQQFCRYSIVEPIDDDDLDGERLRWRGWDDCWHYAAQSHVFHVDRFFA